MGVQGARGNQIKSIGFGEEVPIVSGHSKNSWQKNRRVEIKYDNY
jgi:outer membrane protein OmpA-like peptidoglycan-associated protein